MANARQQRVKSEDILKKVEIVKGDISEVDDSLNSFNTLYRDNSTVKEQL